MLKHGGSAFPSPSVVHDPQTQEPFEAGEAGMTLRDYFAGQAIIGLLSHPMRSDSAMAVSKEIHGGDADAASRHVTECFGIVAYEMADAMLAAREASK